MRQLCVWRYEYFCGWVVFCLLLSVVARSEVLFERQIDEETRRRHKIWVNHVYLRRGITQEKLEEEIARRVQQAKEEPTILKLELLRDAEEGNRPYFRGTLLGEDLVRLAEERKWTEQALRELAVGRDVGEFKHVRSFGKLWPPKHVLLDELGEIGILQEEFKGPSGEYVVVSLVECEKEMSDHEFARGFIREDFRLIKTEYGFVVSSRDRWGITSAGGSGHRFFWMAGPKLRVRVSALGVDPSPLLDLYGPKHKSTLPADFRVEKLEWARRDVDFWLEKMERILSTEEGKEAARLFVSCLHYLFRHAYVPVIDQNLMPMYSSSVEELKKEYEAIASWFEANRSRSFWDEDTQRLMVKGFTPEDIERQRRERVKEEEEAAWAKLRTPAEMERLEALFIDYYEKMLRARVKENKKRFGERPGMKPRPGGGWILTVHRSPQTVVQETHKPPEISTHEGRPRASIEIRLYAPDDRKRWTRTDVFEYSLAREGWLYKGKE